VSSFSKKVVPPSAADMRRKRVFERKATCQASAAFFFGVVMEFVHDDVADIGAAAFAEGAVGEGFLRCSRGWARRG
jgi:hypothetical protein